MRAAKPPPNTQPLMDEHAFELAKKASLFAAAHPGVQPVGLVLARGSAALRRIVDAIPEAAGTDLIEPVFVGVVDREFALTFLRVNVPAALDWLVSDTHGKWRQLPVIAAIQAQVGMGLVEYCVGDPGA